MYSAGIVRAVAPKGTHAGAVLTPFPEIPRSQLELVTTGVFDHSEVAFEQGEGDRSVRSVHCIDA
jgi:hypothetical protein